MPLTVHTGEQRTDEWFALHVGKLTASRASKIITPSGSKSSTFGAEAARVVAEAFGLQEPENGFESDWMDRGKEMEEEARAWFTVDTGIETSAVSFVERAPWLGASPDALIQCNGTAIPLELKCPKPATHLRWVRDGVLPREHKAQVYFQMAMMRSTTAYFMSYHPEIVALIVKVEADEYYDKLRKLLDEFVTDCEKLSEVIK
jgi:putative phage-type endonuclease